MHQKQQSPRTGLCGRYILGALAIAGVGAAHAAVDAADAGVESVRCGKLSALKLDAAAITLAQWTPAGTFDPRSPAAAGSATANATAPPQPGMQVRVPSFCRVAATLQPSRDSSIRIEVWLPAATQWNGRFQAVGNGGLAGSIMYQPMAEALAGSYATASTDTGHSGTAVSGEWALGHPEKVVDFGYRAVHEMTVKAQAIVAAYYGRKPRYSYWNGCSEGGNQALGEAQRFADDYDGILAGAPANYMTHLQAGGNWISQAIHKDPQTFLPAGKLPMINKAVLDACDARDGVRDGVLNDPRDCNYDIAQLRCEAGDGPGCLTDAQIAGIRKVYQGAKQPRTGELIFPGHALGSELEWSNWIAGTATPPTNLQHLIQNDFFKFLVFADANWDWRGFDQERDVALADKKVGRAVNQVAADLDAFRKRGGKMIQYHGWYDPAISPLNSIAYFDSVQHEMHDTSGFYRLFMVPGMYHCRGGPGAHEFDKMAAIVDWVERGAAPEALVAASAKRDFTRPLCSYPKVAKYRGIGSNAEAASFVCAARNQL
jgi:feruloyl esterase